jgi:MFS family permease
LGSSNLLWCDALSFFVSALLIGSAVPAFAPREKQRRKEQQDRYLSGLAENLRFLGQQQVMLALVFTVMVTELLDAADSTVVMPVYVQQVFGNPIILGLLWGIFGGMAFLGAIIFGAIGHRLPRRLTFGLCFMLLSLRFWSMAFYLPLWALIGTFALAGLAAGPLNPLILTVQQRLIPAQRRARILSIISTGYMAGTPLGGLLGGGLITWLGLTASLFLMAVCSLLATSSLLVNPGLKSLDEHE